MLSRCCYTTIIVFCFLISLPRSTQTDTYGHEFVFVYPPNNSGSRGTNATLDIINPDTRKHAAITIEYSEFIGDGDNITSLRRIATTDVKILSNILFVFNKTVILDNIKEGLHRYLDARILVTSSIPVSLVAHSVDISGSMDSFLVLPTSIAGRNYALTLPPSAISGSTIVYFLPTIPEHNQKIKIHLIRKTSTCICTQTVQIGEMLAFSSSQESITLWAHSNIKFVIIAAIRGLPTAHKSSVIDFGCFMPIPISTADCDKLSVQDDHITQILTGKYYLFTTPTASCESVEIVVRGSNKNVEKKHLLSDIVGTPQIISHDHYGNTAAISCTTAMLSLVRYGGYDVGTLNYEEGAYLYEVPAISQFVTGMTPLVIPTESNQITVIADYKAMSSIYFDGEISMTFAPLPFLDGSFYYASGSVQPGFHFLYADGLYIVYVTGRSNNNSAYGFVTAFNSRKLVKPLSTTTARLTPPKETTTITQRVTVTLPVTKVTLNNNSFPVTKMPHSRHPTTTTHTESKITMSTELPRTTATSSSSPLTSLPCPSVFLICVGTALLFRNTENF